MFWGFQIPNAVHHHACRTAPKTGDIDLLCFDVSFEAIFFSSYSVVVFAYIYQRGDPFNSHGSKIKHRLGKWLHGQRGPQAGVRSRAHILRTHAKARWAWPMICNLSAQEAETRILRAS